MFGSFDPDGPHYLLTGEVTKVRQNGATSGIGVLATYGYDDRGNRTSATYGNGATQAFGYDGISRLSNLTVNLSGTASDLTKTFAYNPASQTITETRSNDAYAQTIANISQATVTNGLNQLSTVNGIAAAYDGRGNMTTDPVTGKTYSYLPSNNQLFNIPSPFATFTYDGLDRLANVSNGGILTNYVTDGSDVVAEYNSSNVLQKRYAFDASGQPLVQYDSAGNRSWMLPDERGSIIALADDSAAMTAIDTYDEYGIPGASNQGTFQYAGMMWLVRPGVYAPTFRAYNQLHGRFHQTDPIGFAGGVNQYAYVFNNPVNVVDPLGFGGDEGINVPPCPEKGCPTVPDIEDIFVNGSRPPLPDNTADFLPMINYPGIGDIPFRGPTNSRSDQDIVVTGIRPPRVNFQVSPLTMASFSFDVSTKFLRTAAPQSAKTQDFCGSGPTAWVPEGNWAEACKIHDDCYGTRGANKEVCDINLLRNMLMFCTARMGNSAVCTMAAVVYWIGVTGGGWGPYRRGQSPR